MTQAIAALTTSAVYIATDRKTTVTLPDGSVELRDDLTCKLVNVRDVCGVAYTGWAEIGGMPTHEWIADAILNANAFTTDPTEIPSVLATAAEAAWTVDTRRPLEQTFLVAGWETLGPANAPGVMRFKPFISLTSNCLADSGARIAPGRKFHTVTRRLTTTGGPVEVESIGSVLARERHLHLEESLRRKLFRRYTERGSMRRIVGEIVRTSKTSDTVGHRVLCCCYPLIPCARRFADIRTHTMVAAEANGEVPSFGYYEAGHDQLLQAAPTTVGLGVILTDRVTRHDPRTGAVSNSFRIAHIRPGARWTVPVGPAAR
jgi:hypothetical protein